MVSTESLTSENVHEEGWKKYALNTSYTVALVAGMGGRLQILYDGKY